MLFRRVFTTIQEVGLDISLLSGFLLNAALSAVLLAQVTNRDNYSHLKGHITYHMIKSDRLVLLYFNGCER